VTLAHPEPEILDRALVRMLENAYVGVLDGPTEVAIVAELDVDT
jgi:hypothetical protein